MLDRLALRVENLAADGNRLFGDQHECDHARYCAAIDPIVDRVDGLIREAAKFYEENMKMFGELRLARALSDEQIEIMRDPRRAPGAKLPRIEDAIKAGGVLCGPPEQIIEDLKGLEKRYPGLDRVLVQEWVGVPKSVCLAQIERFAAEVMPAFQKAKVVEPVLA